MNKNIVRAFALLITFANAVPAQARSYGHGYRSDRYDNDSDAGKVAAGVVAGTAILGATAAAGRRRREERRERDDSKRQTKKSKKRK